ncbi:ribosomal RNA small subunit methyltransferase A, partial [Patescibacteria group bacterium]|nr:ribosomal RNA small subunit methyltransferase A [Patescibacteria group bacterium]
MKPIKYLGQNFLTSRKIVEEIVRAAGLKPDDIILEVGPGKGILTEAILEKIPQGKLIAVEKDNRFVEYLQKKFKNTKNLSIVHGDILKFDIWDLFGNCPPASLCEAFRAGKLGFGNYKIVANIPYYITSRFLRNFLQSDFQPSLIVVMMQKEVAERIVAKDGKESILSIAVKAYGQPRIVRAVAAKYFSPKPKVDSAILLIDNINCARLSLAHEKEFFG